MNVLGVPSEDFERIEKHLEWHFASFEDRSKGTLKAEELAEDVKRGERQCWIVWDGTIRACALTEVNDRHLRTVTVTHCAGRGRSDWQDLLMAELAAWARHIEAQRLITVSRPGYTKFLKSIGFRETHRVMEQDL